MPADSPSPSSAKPGATLLPRAIVLLAIALLVAASAGAQEGERPDGPRVRYVLSIGDHPRVDGIRLNYRDTDFDLVRGANITIWTPYEGDWTGQVKGLALGLPSTGAGTIRGIGAGVVGIAAREELTGLAVGGIGVGSGGRIRGIALGGIGVGAGEVVSGIAIGGIGVGGGGDVRGLAIGGIGVGGGGDLRGLAIGGIGVGSGGSASGLLVGGVGAGVAGNLRYVAIGGIGVGAGGNATGLLIGGIGAGVGGDLTGIAIGGVGVGAGGTARGLLLGGVGVGAPEIVGVAIGGLVEGDVVQGLILAPLRFRTTRGGEITGAAASIFNHVRGDVHGLTVGLVNYAWSVEGFQLGVINVIRDNPRGRRVLPVVNW